MEKFNNLVAIFEASAKHQMDKTCFRFVENGSWQSLNWAEVKERVQKIAGGLRALGLQSGDRICILSRTRYEWTLADLGIMAAGGVVVPIYESSTPDQVQFIIQDSEAKLVFVENEAQFKKVQEVQDELKTLQQIVSFDSLPKKLLGESLLWT